MKQAPIERCRVRRVHTREPTDLERTFYAGLVRQLVAARDLRGWSQEDLDQRLGVTDGQVAKWESFRRLPGAFMLMCWAVALGVSVAIERAHHDKEE
jgi:transcriptional regulator with XRE-family HTH domain